MSQTRYTIQLSHSALQDLQCIARPQASQILRKIERLETGLHGNIKRLQNADCAYRLRMGDYRVLFDVTGSTILIRRIGHRRDVYD